jgi:hypothetical protein
MIVNDLGQPAGDSVGAAEIFHGRRHDAVKAAEMSQKTASPGRADARYVLQFRPPARLGASRPVAGDGETVRLVADFLDQVKTGVIRWQL